jgi:hypothetical protein
MRCWECHSPELPLQLLAQESELSLRYDAELSAFKAFLCCRKHSILHTATIPKGTADYDCCQKWMLENRIGENRQFAGRQLLAAA